MIDEKLLLEKIELLRKKCEHGRSDGKMRALAFEECALIIRAMVPYDKELEQAAQQYEYNHDGLPWGESKERLTDGFKAGAQWQRQHEEPVSEDLEKAAQEYVTKEGYLAGLKTKRQRCGKRTAKYLSTFKET